jgi:hypothetical protein
MILKATLSGIVPAVLFWGFFLTPFTSLRFGFIGPGEILIVIAGLLILFISHGKILMDDRTRILSRFWVLFLSVSLCGLFYNSLVLGFASGRPFSPVFDFLAYSFVLFSILITGHLARTDQISAISFFTRLFSYWAVTYVALYGLSFVTSSIFGMPLRYHHFFSPLVENVHQAASITCVMGFIMVFIALKSKKLFIRILCLASAILFGKMALDSGATKAFLGVLFGAITSVVFLLMYRPSGRNRFVFNILSFTALTVAVFAIIARGDLIVEVATRFFMENDGGGARDALYSVGLTHGTRSVLIGYGPGSHAPYGGGFADAHNTTLTVFLQGGLIGVLVLLVFAARFAKQVAVSPTLIGAATAIGMYFLGGDILRRLPTWIMLTGLVYFASGIHLVRRQRSQEEGHGFCDGPLISHDEQSSRNIRTFSFPLPNFPRLRRSR